MLPVYILAIFLHAAFSQECQDGIKIIPEEVYNPSELIGTWRYVYHWDNLNTFDTEVLKDDEYEHVECVPLEISQVTDELVEKKKSECAAVQDLPVEWEDATLKFDSPAMNIEDAIIFVGRGENWLMSACNKLIRVEFKKVSDDFLAIINPDVGYNTELLSRSPLTYDEFSCTAHNVDFGVTLSGMASCY